MTIETEIPFSFFVELVGAIATIKPHKASEKQSKNTLWLDTPTYKTFQRWSEALRERYSPLPHKTTAIVFQFLFPDEDGRRKYGMQEARLAQHLVRVFGVSGSKEGRGERLKNWNEEGTSGCLGDEVFAVMSATDHSQATTPISLNQVDALLIELASKCAYSDSSVRSSVNVNAASLGRTREAALTSLYALLTPAEGAVVTQIILKDLRPLLYPLPEAASHYASALLQYKSNAVAMLTKEAAMHAWDPTGRMLLIFKSRANLEDTALTYESFQAGGSLPKPTIGTPIQIPKCTKGQGTAQALRVLKGADKVWVETKYDGERAQIHVWVEEDGLPRIKIFSKSGRDSTLDRAGIHPIICDALGLPRRSQMSTTGPSPPAAVAPSIRTNIILEAEMVAFSETLGRIDEFWRIRSLIASTAMGVRHQTPFPVPSTTQEMMQTQNSLVSNGSDGGSRHLALVFFDVLLLEGVSLLSIPYAERRSILERTINPSPGHAMFAERTCVDMRHVNAEETFRKAFASLIADRQEGAVLKAGSATYNERRWPWVKLKRDYIQGHGDTVDLVLVGASWEKDRARELRVPPTTYTSFYFAALVAPEIDELEPLRKPRFDIMFTSSYGLSREELEELNFMIKSSDTVPYGTQEAYRRLSYTYNLPRIPPPTVLLQRPLLAEVLGAGFTKALGNTFYELRFPRISKVYRPSDRPWFDGIGMAEFQRIAREVVGRDRPGKAEDDWVKRVFRPNEPTSPSVRCPKKRKQMETVWVEKLELVDRKTNARGNTFKKTLTDETVPTCESANIENVNMITTQDGGQFDAKALNARLKLSPLDSVTNVAATYHSSRGTSNSRPPPAASKLQHTPAHHSVGSPFRPVYGLEIPHSSTSRGETSPVLPLKHGPAQISMIGPAATLPSPTNEGSEKASEKGTFTLHHFLQASVVWLARPSGALRPVWRAPSYAVIPTGNQVSTLDAVALACGWHDVAPCHWAKRGVLFIDDSEAGQACATQVLAELVKRRAALLEANRTVRVRPILVLSARMLAYDVLDQALTEEDLEERAICRFG